MKAAVAGLAVALVLLVGGATAADTLDVHLVSQNNNTITLGWTPVLSGYGYLFSADGQLVSRTNDPSRDHVRFSKSYSTYEVAVIVKGATGTYPPAPPPPPPPDTTAPTVPGNLRVTAATQTSVSVGWDASTDNVAVAGYTVFSGASQVATQTGLSFAYNGLQCGTSYTLSVDAFDAAGNHSAKASITAPTSACVTPTGFPDSTNTGVPAGTTLTSYTGPSRITVANTVIDGKTLGCIEISAPGVMIRNSKVSCGGGYAVYVDDRTSTSTLVTVEDSEIDCKNSPGSAGVGEADFVVRRVEITGCENGFDINQNALIEDSYVHDLYNGGGSHLDGAQLAGGHWNGSGYPCCAQNVTLRHNTMLGMGDGDTSFGTSAIISNPRGDVNVLIEHNLLAGGAYTLYCDYQATATNYRVIDNHFSTRFKSTVGFYGVSDGCGDETQSGNVIHETGKPITLG